MIRDFNVTDAVDMTPGTLVAAIAAAHHAASYYAFCHNPAHKQWLDNLINRVFAAMVLNKDVAADQEFVKLVGAYLQRAAEAAKHMLTDAKSAIGDSFTGEDDSDDEQ